MTIYFVLQTLFLLSNTGQSLSDDYGKGSDSTGLLLLGYFTWILVSACVTSIGQEMYDELASGTFYRKMNCSIPLPILYLGKLLSTVLFQSAISIMLGIIAIVFWHITISINLFIIITIAICLFGMYGLGLAIGGLFIYFKKVTGVTMIVQVFLLFASNILSNNAGMGQYFSFIPLTRCVDLIRKSAASVTIDATEYATYVALSIVFFTIGYAAIHLLIKQAKKNGSLLLV
jgi:ABC-2 type transport system permease protein